MVRLKRFGLFLVGILMMVFVGLATTACSGVGKVKTIEYDGETITWSKAKNASGYAIEIDEGGSTIIDDPDNLEWWHSAGDAESVTVTIYPLDKKNKQGKETTRTFNRLDTIEEVTFNAQGQMSWKAVEGANSYLISIDGETVKTGNATVYNKFPRTGYELDIKIRPTNTKKHTFSYWSQSYYKTYLPNVTNITYDGEKIEWEGGNPAGNSDVKFDVTINGDKKEGVPGYTYAYPNEEKNVTVRVKAVNVNEKNLDIYEYAQTPLEKTFKYLPRMQGTEITVENGQLRWDDWHNAHKADVESYVIKYDNSGGYKSSETSFYDLNAGYNYTNIQIKPIAEGAYFSAWSEAVAKVYVLKAPNLMWNNIEANGSAVGALYWNDVDNAAAYTIEMVEPGKTTATVTPDYVEKSFRESYLKPGTYTVKVQATPAIGSGDYPSAFSETMTVIRLAAPNETSVKVTSTERWNNEKVQVAWDKVKDATGYRVLSGSKEIMRTSTREENSMTFNPGFDKTKTVSEQIEYTIQSLGSNWDNKTNTVRLASVMVEDGTSVGTSECKFILKTKDAPTLPTFNDGSHLMQWTAGDGVSNVNYAIKTATSDDDGAKKTYFDSVSKQEFDLYGLGEGYFYLSVCTEGNGTNELASNDTNAVKVYRLSTPTDLKMQLRTDGKPVLLWEYDDQKDNRGHQIAIGNNHTDLLDVPKDGDIGNFITTNVVAINLYTVGNFKSENDGFIITSKPSDTFTATKLDEPTKPKTGNQMITNNDTLVWNKSNNAPTDFMYVIYKGASILGTSMSPEIKLSELKEANVPLGAGTHTVYIRCIGSGTWISSKLSETFTFTILDTPTLNSDETSFWWEPVEYADHYVIKIAGKEAEYEPVVEGGEVVKYVCNPKNYLTEVGDNYSVTLQAIGNNGIVSVSGLNPTVNSKITTKTQRVVRLDAPEFTLAYQKNGVDVQSFDKTASAVVTITGEVSNAVGYQFIRSNTATETKEELSYTYNPESKSGAIQFSVRAIGGKFNNGIYYITSEDQTAKTLWIVEEPSIIADGTKKITVMADMLNGAMPAGKYTVTINYKNGTQEVKTTSGNEQLEVGAYSTIESIEVCANYGGWKGNVLQIGSETTTFDPSQPII